VSLAVFACYFLSKFRVLTALICSREFDSYLQFSGAYFAHNKEIRRDPSGNILYTISEFLNALGFVLRSWRRGSCVAYVTSWCTPRLHEDLMLQECRCIRHPKFRIVVVFENQGLVQSCRKCHCYSTGCLGELISCSSWCDAREHWI
jgi:hypothetical protein